MPSNDNPASGATDAPVTNGAVGVDGQNAVSDATNGSQAVATPAVAGAVTNPALGAATPAATVPAASLDANGMPVANPAMGVQDGAAEKSLMGSDSELLAEVARKIGEAHNVLVALSGNPSVDEMAAAIGLSLYLDKLGKKATAIYSGETPNALEFLKPEKTFETSADVLQDFVIALNKDKADHLRYKLDGDYVKIYITPYKSRVSQEDLDFSYDDYNVDLVLALDVANGVDLDSALREHGRIMHDSVIINITTGNPGKLGEIEWSDKRASSVSEMIARLLYKMNVNGQVKIEKDEATAFLTGIVAATDRFSNAGTTPETMRIASKLMESGANQQLVSKNITSDVENEMFNIDTSKKPSFSNDPVNLAVEHDGEDEASVATDGGEANGSAVVNGGGAVAADSKGGALPASGGTETANNENVAASSEDKAANNKVPTTPNDSGATDESKDGALTQQSDNSGGNDILEQTGHDETNAASPQVPQSDTRAAVSQSSSDGASTDASRVNGTEAKKAKEEEVEDAEAAAMLDDLKAAEMSLAAAGVGTMPEKVDKPIDIKDVGGESNNIVSMPVGIPAVSTGMSGATSPSSLSGMTSSSGGVSADANVAGSSPVGGSSGTEVSPNNGTGMGAAVTTNGVGNEGGLLGVTHDGATGGSENAGMTSSVGEGFMKETPEKVIQPPTGGVDAVLPTVVEDENKYGKMLEEALAGLNETGGSANVVSEPASNGSGATAGPTNTGGTSFSSNPAAMSAPSVTANPEINGVPEINYMPMPGDSVLPPPPTPPIDTTTPMPTVPAVDMGGTVATGGAAGSAVTPIAPAVPTPEPTPTSLGSQPAMQDQVYRPQAADPSAFKIPGM